MRWCRRPGKEGWPQQRVFFRSRPSPLPASRCTPPPCHHLLCKHMRTTRCCALLTSLPRPAPASAPTCCNVPCIGYQWGCCKLGCWAEKDRREQGVRKKESVRGELRNIALRSSSSKAKPSSRPGSRSRVCTHIIMWIGLSPTPAACDDRGSVGAQAEAAAFHRCMLALAGSPAMCIGCGDPRHEMAALCTPGGWLLLAESASLPAAVAGCIYFAACMRVMLSPFSRTRPRGLRVFRLTAAAGAAELGTRHGRTERGQVVAGQQQSTVGSRQARASGTAPAS